MTDIEILNLYRRMDAAGAAAWIAFGSGIARPAPVSVRPLLRLARPALFAIQNELDSSVEASADLRAGKAVGSK